MSVKKVLKKTDGIKPPVFSLALNIIKPSRTLLMFIFIIPFTFIFYHFYLVS